MLANINLFKCTIVHTEFYQKLSFLNVTAHINSFTYDYKVNNDNACIGGLLENFAHIGIYQFTKKLRCTLRDFFNDHQMKIVIKKIR